MSSFDTHYLLTAAISSLENNLSSFNGFGVVCKPKLVGNDCVYYYLYANQNDYSSILAELNQGAVNYERSQVTINWGKIIDLRVSEVQSQVREVQSHIASYIKSDILSYDDEALIAWDKDSFGCACKLLWDDMNIDGIISSAEHLGSSQKCYGLGWSYFN